MTSFESDELDQMLRDLLATRPAPAARADLAQLAVRRARADVAPRRFRRLNWTLNAIAAVWIVLVAGQQLHARYAAGGFQSWFSYEQGVTTPSTDSTQVISTATVPAATTDYTALWLLGGGATALIATAGLLAERAAGDVDEAWATLPV